jgi:hypothetical protein
MILTVTSRDEVTQANCHLTENVKVVMSSRSSEKIQIELEVIISVLIFAFV